MRMFYLAATTLTVVVAMGAGLVAQGRVTVYQPRGSRIQSIEAWRPTARGGDTRIVGSVIDIGQKVVAKAKVQLRNIDTGEVEQENTSDENGEYAFDVTEGGAYIVEMVMVDGYIVAVSNAGSLSRFETMQTVIQLPGRWDTPTQTVILTQAPTNFVGMSAQTTMTAATVTLAVESNIRPADPGEPVSPRQ